MRLQLLCLIVLGISSFGYCDAMKMFYKVFSAVQANCDGSRQAAYEQCTDWFTAYGMEQPFWIPTCDNCFCGPTSATCVASAEIFLSAGYPFLNQVVTASGKASSCPESQFEAKTAVYEKVAAMSVAKFVYEIDPNGPSCSCADDKSASCSMTVTTQAN